MNDVYIKTIQLPERVQKLFRNQDIISINKLIDELDDTLYELNCAEDEKDRLKEYYEDNYKPIDNYELYGVSEKDFH